MRTLKIFETIYGRTIFNPVDRNYRLSGSGAFRRFDKVLGEHVYEHQGRRKKANKKT